MEVLNLAELYDQSQINALRIILLDQLATCSCMYTTCFENLCRAAQNFGGFGTARKLVENILTADHTNNS